MNNFTEEKFSLIHQFNYLLVLVNLHSNFQATGHSKNLATTVTAHYLQHWQFIRT